MCKKNARIVMFFVIFAIFISVFNVSLTSFAEIDGTSVSRLGHIRNEGTTLYDKNSMESIKKLSNSDIKKVYYIKKEKDYNNSLYYLISLRPSSETGVLGWVKAQDVFSHEHQGTTMPRDNVYMNGIGLAYSKAWGGELDEVYSDLSRYKGYELKVNKTEKVGNNTWYRGTLDGRQIFVHENFVTTVTEYSTSQLGHIREPGKVVYDKETMSELKTLNTEDINQVYYIKRAKRYNDELYYLISVRPSDEQGVIGWIKNIDIFTHPHHGTSMPSNKMYINGVGLAYDKAWGGKNDLVFNNLEKYIGYEFKINKTEKVGNNIWYRGMLDGKQIFLHENFVSKATENSISRLGQIYSSGTIVYDSETMAEKQKLDESQINQVYYIKKEKYIGNKRFFLISLRPSASEGILGWVKNEDIRALPHFGTSMPTSKLYLNGRGKAFSKAWGGSEDIVFQSTDDYLYEEFVVNKTEKVGNNTWYRGILNNKQVFLHESSLNATVENDINYNYTLNDMINIQLQRTPQTDKYRQMPAYIHSSLVGTDGSSGFVDAVNVALRTSPNTSSSDNIYKRVSDVNVTILGEMQGSAYLNSNLWYKIRFENRELYVHSLLVTLSELGTLNTNANVRSDTDSNSHIYSRLNKGSKIKVLKTVQGESINNSKNWYEIALGTWRLPTRKDIESYLIPSEQDKYQFLLLNESADVVSSELNSILSGQGVLSGKGSSFIQAGKKHSVNEAYLVSHSLLETGRGWSRLATGIEVGKNSNGNLVLVTNSNRSALSSIKTVYNVYGIGAVDRDPINEGAKYAYRNGWFTVETAIIEGAAFVSNNYFSVGQTTLYKMRWNPDNPGVHQYATDIGWAAKQTTLIKNIHNQLTQSKKVFEIPKYN